MPGNLDFKGYHTIKQKSLKYQCSLNSTQVIHLKAVTSIARHLRGGFPAVAWGSRAKTADASESQGPFAEAGHLSQAPAPVRALTVCPLACLLFTAWKAIPVLSGSPG